MRRRQPLRTLSDHDLFGVPTPCLKYTPQDVRYTSKGNTVYAIVLDWPGAGQEVLLETFANLEGDLAVSRVSMLGAEGDVKWQSRDNGLALATPQSKPHDLAVVFKIETTGSAKLKQAGAN